MQVISSAGPCGASTIKVTKLKLRLTVTVSSFSKKVSDVICLVEGGFALAVELVRRSSFRLHPRLYSERLRIRTVTEGLAPKTSNKFAVFVVYAKSKVPKFTMNAITTFGRWGYNLIIVSNARIDAAEKTNLLRNCCLLIERVNFGRDFGVLRALLSCWSVPAFIWIECSPTARVPQLLGRLSSDPHANVGDLAGRGRADQVFNGCGTSSAHSL
jgi:hypothetical protein